MRTLFHALLTLVLVAAFGCGDSQKRAPVGTAPTLPPESGELGINGDSQPEMWGAFEFALSDTGDLTVHAVDRTGAIVVDPYVQVDLLQTHFNPETRIWDIDAAFTNLTKRTAFGLWVAFYNLNGNRILGQDGFATPEQGGDYPAAPGFGQRKPVVALGKDQDRRRFLGGSTLTGHIRIQWPAGATNFNGLRFYLDAAFPNARQEPIVENLMLTPGSSSTHAILTAYIKDWQQNAAPLDVGAAIVPSVLPVIYPLRDDGVAPDAVAGDDLWTTEIPRGNNDQKVVVTARDSGGWHFENELAFHTGPIPCPDSGHPGQYLPFLTGQHSQIQDQREVVASNPAEWNALWSQHAPGSAPPPVDFQCFNVYAVFLGSFNTGGHGVMPSLHPVSSLLPELCYVAFHPGAGCPVTQAFTQPWRIWLGPKLNAVAWHRSDRINECEIGNAPFQTIFKGTTPATGIQQIQRLFQNQAEFANAWGDLQLPGQVPCVDFATETAVLVSQGTVERAGHVAMITKVDANAPPSPGNPIEFVKVHWEAIAPGTNCVTEPGANTPIHVGVLPKVPEAFYERTNRLAEPCGPGGQCEDFFTLKSALHHAHPNQEGVRLVINSLGQWEEFWQATFPEMPRPTVNLETRSIVVVALETFPTGGHSLEIDCVSRGPGAGGNTVLTVEYTHTGPGANCQVPQVLTRPIQVLSIPKYLATPVNWVRHDVQAPACPPPGDCHETASLVPLGEYPNFKPAPYQQVIVSPTQYEGYWFQAFPNEAQRPPVNFETDTVWAIGVTHPGAKVEITCIRKEPNPAGLATIVEYAVTFPGANCEPFRNRNYAVVKTPGFQPGNTLVEWRGTEIPGAPCEPECRDYMVIRDQQLSFKEGPYSLLINNQEAWEHYWSEAYPNEPPAPQVDFETKSVIALSIGAVSLEGHDLEIDCIRLTGTGLHVDFTHHHPHPSCVGVGLFRPVLIVAIPKFTGTMTTEKRLVFAEPCDPDCYDYVVLTQQPQVPEAEPATLVLRSQAALNEYWFARYPGSNPPQVNFEERMVIAINTGTLAVPRRPLIDCVQPPVNPNEVVRVQWHREIINLDCPFTDGNNALVVTVPRSPGVVEFIQADDTVDECD